MDHHMGWMWILIPFFFFVMFRRRSWMGWDHRGNKRRFQRSMDTMRDHVETTSAGSSRLSEELEDHRRYVDQLENRVAELENRLDFTERLLAGRQEVNQER